jgi:diacylglycerol kinase (ATP)
MDVLLLASGRSGGSSDESVEAARTVLAAAGAVEVATAGDRAALDAVLDRRQERLLVIAGGDGSLHTTVQRLWRRKELAAAPLGLIPLGTGNDFARHLGLPLEPRAAAQSIVDGQPRRLDLLRDDHGGVVVNVAHLGIGADAAKKALRWKDRLGKVAFPLGAARALLRPRGVRLHVEVDDEVPADGSWPVLMVGIANGSTIGGGAPLFPDARADDGRLDVVVMGPPAVGGPKGPSGERFQMVRRASGRAVTVRLPTEVDIGTNTDGELGRMSGQRSWWVEPGAWSLVH